MPAKNFVGAAKAFFGLKTNQTMKDFGNELRNLSDQDYRDLVAGLVSEGALTPDGAETSLHRQASGKLPMRPGVDTLTPGPGY